MADRAQLDKITRTHTAFATFQELIDAKGYFPSIRTETARGRKARADRLRLADAYDKAQADRGDGRRAFRS